MTESRTLDFKAEAYDFSPDDVRQRERKRALFLKDVIAMYNTPRDGDSHILLGIKKHSSGSYDLVGVQHHPDDADLRSKFELMVHPHPDFEYSTVTLDGLSFGVLTIPSRKSVGPCVPTRDVQGILKRNQVYVRRGSQNAEADLEEQRDVYRWFSGTGAKPSLQATGDGAWDSILKGAEAFSDLYRFVLLVPRIDQSGDLPLENLGRVDWGLSIDFDPESDLSGTLSACETLLSERRAIHRISIGDRTRMRPEQATYWFFAQGLAGRGLHSWDGTWRTWYAAFEGDLRNQIQELARSDTGKPVIVIAVITSDKHLEQYESVFDICISTFGEAVTILGVDCSGDGLTFGPKYNATMVAIRLDHFLHGLNQIQHADASGGAITFPSISGSPITIQGDSMPWLAEDLEAVHLGVGQRPPADRVPERDFLRGHEITWYDLALHCDVDRDLLPRLEDAVRTGLERRETARINLFHAPGAGGTTLSRRLLWNLRHHFPCLILKSCVPDESVERVSRVGNLTGKSICLVVETSSVSEGEIDRLFSLLKARHVPVVIVQVGRRLTDSHEGPRSLFLQSGLSRRELEGFGHYLARAVPGRSSQVLGATTSSRAEFHTPFYLALTAFGKDFIGIEKYVQARLANISDAQARVFAFYALAHYYGQLAIPSQMFAVELGLPVSKAVSIERALPEPMLELLIEDQPGIWRPRHYLIAQAGLEFLMRSHDDPRTWRQQLSHWAKEFATFCHDATETVLDRAIQLVLRCFLFRDNADFLGTERSGTSRFAQLLEDIPEDNGRLEVLRHLADLFPEEAHVWAHLGRFYAYRLREHELSLQATDRALSLRPDDNVLHHMRGMALRAAAYDQMQMQVDAGTILDTVRQATAAFAEARQLNSEDEHGYISEAQMLLRLLDHLGKEFGRPATDLATSGKSDPIVREAFQAIEDLLAQVRQIRSGEGASRYEEECRSQLDLLYGRHDEALQGWQNLLDRRDVYAPPVRRQIVWTLLARRQRSWENLSQRELERSVELLRENISVEPGEPKNMRLWMRGIRRLSNPPSLEAILEQVAYWRANADSLESAYYAYVVNMLMALKGSALALERGERALDESKARSAAMRNRTRSHEWIGQGDGIQQLINQDQLGAWNNDIQFFEKTGQLERLSGIISSIKKPEAGQIELSGAVRAFFVPGHSGHSKGVDENRRITCFLGFSYDGPRAWDVKNL